MKTAIVILNWNGSAMMQRYLPSVISNSTEAEVVVADNASTDDSLDMLSREFPSVRTIILDKNYGFAGGYNHALKLYEEENSKRELPLPDYYVLLNSDVRLTNDWLTPLTDYMDTHPEVAACQPKLLSDTQTDHFEYAGACGGYIDKYGYPFCRGRIMGYTERDNGQYDTVARIMWATGACLLIRRTDYWEAGALDERFFAHNEEIDLCWRLNLRGRAIVCVPQSHVYHLGGGTLPQGNPKKTYLNFRNNLTMLYKNLPDDKLQSVMFARFILDHVAALQALISKGGWSEYRAIINARHDFKKWKAQFTADRERIQQIRTEKMPTDLSPVSILWEYFAKRKRTFSSISL